MQIKKIICFFLFVLLFPLLSLAQVGGESVFGILYLTPSAHMNALGGYQVGLYDKDPSLALFNPAMADSSVHQYATLGVSSYIADINFGYAAFAWHQKDLGTFFGGLNHLGYGNMIMADQDGVINGRFSASETVMFLGYSKRLSPRFSAGVTFKPVSSSIETYNSWGIAVDAGIHFKDRNGHFQAGLLLRNVGRQLSSYSDSPTEFLSPDLMVGATLKLAHAPFRFSVTAKDLLTGSLDFEIPDNEYGITVSQSESVNAGIGDLLLRHLVFGVEFVPSRSFYVGAGLNPRRRQELKVDSKVSTVGYSWGFGFRIYKFRFGYSSARYHLASSSNHFSITTNISDF
ncbi:type IX secretion system protein PorQ [Thermophagus sp. OGC60D27]|uniref:type IX secretion system protein PorQ n=1 Tax=Thermophagus sp. OGC60D27 TaxID=3458415 RepID=UPI0040382F44